MDRRRARTLGALLDEGLVEGVRLEDQRVEERGGRGVGRGVEDGARRGLELPGEHAYGASGWLDSGWARRKDLSEVGGDVCLVDELGVVEVEQDGPGVGAERVDGRGRRGVGEEVEALDREEHGGGEGLRVEQDVADALDDRAEALDGARDGGIRLPPVLEGGRLEAEAQRILGGCRLGEQNELELQRGQTPGMHILFNWHGNVGAYVIHEACSKGGAV